MSTPSAEPKLKTNGPITSQEAIRRIRSTGANVRTQAPLINHVNADPATWASMWRLQTRLGAIPYYMFVERDTGARQYFEVRFALTPLYCFFFFWFCLACDRLAKNN